MRGFSNLRKVIPSSGSEAAEDDNGHKVEMSSITHARGKVGTWKDKVTSPWNREGPVPRNSDSNLGLSRKRGILSRASGAFRRALPSSEKIWRFFVICLVFFLLIFFLFVYPKHTYWTYVSGELRASTDPTRDHLGLYELNDQYSQCIIVLDVNDDFDSVGRPDSYRIANYKDNVNIPMDRENDPGWNLQDILGYDRAAGSEEWEGNPGTMEPLDGLGARAIYDYTEGAVLNRTDWMKNFDSDYFNIALEPHPNADKYGYFGIPLGDVNIAYTSPTSSNFVCNLGPQRIKTSGITLNVKGCHVEVHSDNGDGYRLFIKHESLTSISSSVSAVVTRNDTSGCKTKEVTAIIENPSCPSIMIPGIDTGCEELCRVILLKGKNARRLPLKIIGPVEADSDDMEVHIIDGNLVLEHDRSKLPWKEDPTPDLYVSGNHISAYLSNAFIKRFKADIEFGGVTLDNLRFETANVKIENDDLTITDNRDLTLLYRSAKNFVCLSSSLVEDIPAELNECRMKDDSNPHKDAHVFYEYIADGVISKDEFLRGIDDLGLDFEEDSLDLDERAQEALFDHVFRYTNPDSTMTAMTYDKFQEQLETLAPYFTTLYDSEAKSDCIQSGGGNECAFACANITDPVALTYGGCDTSQGCLPGCGSPDTVITTSTEEEGAIDFHFYDRDPADGVITYEEFKQAVLKIYGNCTYIITPEEQDFLTCKYSGGGQYDVHTGGPRRECKSYRDVDTNRADWRINNTNLADLPDGFRECRPFPDYDLRLNGKVYDANCSDAECFLPNGDRVPEQYYNRSTWSQENYNSVRALLYDAFPYTGKFGQIPYFNMTDADQFREFANKIFAKTEFVTTVDYDTFNSNLHSLYRIEDIGKNYYLFNTNCYRGKFMKVRPNWHEFEESDAYVISRKPSGGVRDTNMPGYRKSLSSDEVGACPPEWGNPDDGIAPRNPDGTLFSYFPWADNSTMTGYRWGKSLPKFCRDEQWPGIYPNLERNYGTMAGKAIPPGCVPSSCYGIIKANVPGGSIHAQSLPFVSDPLDANGDYMNMIKSCNSTDGASQCFFKGYEDSFSNRIIRADVDSLNILRDKYSSNDEEDNFSVLSLTGHGVPNYEKWFWGTRRVYIDVEPAWVKIFSGTVLGPTLTRADIHFSPGICDARLGAVERIDWRDPCINSQSDPVIECENLIAEEHTRLRELRDEYLFDAIYDQLVDEADRAITGLIAKKYSVRQLYDGESFYRDPRTKDGEQDVNALNWNYKKVCIPQTDCYEYLLHLDNCLVPRTPVLTATANGTAIYQLSPCVFPDSSPACHSGWLNDFGDCIDGISFNESIYQSQFGSQSVDLTTESADSLLEGDTVYSHFVTTQYRDRYGDVEMGLTKSYYKFLQVEYDKGEYSYRDLQRAWLDNLPLTLCLLLSVCIATMCGLAAMALIMVMGCQKLKEFNKKLRKDEVMIEQKRRDRRKKVIELIGVERMLENQFQMEDIVKKDEHKMLGHKPLSQAECDDIEEFMLKNGWHRRVDIKDMDPRLMVQKYMRRLDRTHEGVGFDMKDRDGSEEERKGFYGKLFRVFEVDGDYMMNLALMAQRTKGFTHMRYKLQLVSIVYIANICRLFRQPLPSPFLIVRKGLRGFFKKHIINSIRSFVNAKCLRDHTLNADEIINLGGSLVALKEYEIGRRIIRLGVDTEVGVSRTILGKFIRYRVMHASITLTKQIIQTPEGPMNVLIINVEEGPCTYVNQNYEVRKWEENVAPVQVGFGRSYQIPHIFSQGGGKTVDFVIEGKNFTRTVEIDCTCLCPKVRFKTIMRNFRPAYSTFCNENNFPERDLLRSESTLKALNIQMSKRVQTFVMGLRPKSEDDRMEEKKALSTVLALRPARKQKSNQDVENDMNKLRRMSSSWDRAMNMDIEVTGYMVGNKNLLSQKPTQSKFKKKSKMMNDPDEGEYESLLFKTKLESSDSPLAMFILSQYTCTGLGGKDYEEIEVFRNRFQKWCKKIKLDTPLIGESDLEELDMVVETKPFYDMYGCIVSERKDGRNLYASKGTVFLIATLTAFFQMALIVLLPLPLMLAIFQHQAIDRVTTTMKAVLTFETIQQDGMDFLIDPHTDGMPLLSKVVFYICLGYYYHATFEIFIYYLFSPFDKSWWRQVLKTIFYAYIILIVAMTVSYFFLICSWLILGAVIKPDIFLPYCVGTITLFSHAKSQASSLSTIYDKYKKQAMACVGIAFALKLAGALNKKRKQDDKTFDASDYDQPYEVFKTSCGEDETMNYSEFSNLLDKLDIDIVDDRKRLLFAQVDRDSSGELGYNEFEQAWLILQGNVAEAKLRELGITYAKLALMFVYSMLILLMIMAFIFIGVAAFIGAGTLGAVVNSGLTGLSAFAMNVQKKEEKDIEKEVGVVEV